VLDLRELIRYLIAGESNRSIAKTLHLTRRSVSKYRTWAHTHGLLEDPVPSPEELKRLLDQDRPISAPPIRTSSVEPYRGVVTELRQRGVEIATIFQRLHDDHGYTGTYSSVHRFVRALEPRTPDVTIRIERAPGEEAQVDFGYAGVMLDDHGQPHRAWAFVMTLSYSRHQYVEFVFDQKVETWLLLHRHAFEYWGAVPRKIVLDNLKAGIVQACFDEPQVQRAYRDLAEHYGFLIAPCPVRKPQQKGKVESGVHYVKRSFLAGRDPRRVTENNRAVLTWVEQTAGQRIHGTTRWQPQVQFQQVEQTALLPLPPTAFDLVEWKQVQVHRDCYVQFNQSYYSAPCRYVGQKLWVRGDAQTVRIYVDYVLMATHPRATTPGQRQTNLAHLPPEKVDALSLTPERCRAQAAQIGPATGQVVDQWLAERPLDRLRSVRRLLGLAETFTPLRLERACVRALRFETASYRSIQQILQNHLEAEEAPFTVPLTQWPQFARTAEELVHGLGGK
jgi:transposase